MQHRSLISRLRRGAAILALAAAVVLAPAVVATQSAQAQTFTVLHSFAGGTDGANPQAERLIQDAAGNLYGTAYYGGGGPCNDGNGVGCGVVFKVDTTGAETVLYSFRGRKYEDGANPHAGLILDAAGNLYGTTYYGGQHQQYDCYILNDHRNKVGCGTVFKLDTTGKETVLATFESWDGSGGRHPVAGLVQDASGNFYGTTLNGGVVYHSIGHCCGAVFKLDTTGKYTVLHAFQPAKDGAYPYSGLVLDAAGNLYGTTSLGDSLQGRPSCCGTVFKVDTTGAETVLHHFKKGQDGRHPRAGLIQDSAGNFYGTTSEGGSECGVPGCGTIFKLDTTGTESVLYSFSGAPDGANPTAGLIQDAAGNLYGTTSAGGASGFGTVFKLDTTGKETVLYSFTGGTDGATPFAGLIRDAAGNFYGTAYGGGASGIGTVFKLTP